MDRVYTQEDLEACLKFVRVKPDEEEAPAAVAAAVAMEAAGAPALTTPIEPAWWPCLWFTNIVECERITKQFNICRDNNIPLVIFKEYGRLYPKTINCPVVLLLGDKPPMRYLFDISIEPRENQAQNEAPALLPLTVVPLMDKAYEFNKKYHTNTEYHQAVEIVFHIYKGGTTSSTTTAVESTTASASATAASAVAALPPTTQQQEAENSHSDDTPMEDPSNSDQSTEQAPSKVAAASNKRPQSDKPSAQKKSRPNTDATTSTHPPPEPQRNEEGLPQEAVAAAAANAATATRSSTTDATEVNTGSTSRTNPPPEPQRNDEVPQEAATASHSSTTDATEANTGSTSSTNPPPEPQRNEEVPKEATTATRSSTMDATEANTGSTNCTNPPPESQRNAEGLPQEAATASHSSTTYATEANTGSASSTNPPPEPQRNEEVPKEAVTTLRSSTTDATEANAGSASSTNPPPESQRNAVLPPEAAPASATTDATATDSSASLTDNSSAADETVADSSSALNDNSDATAESECASNESSSSTSTRRESRSRGAKKVAATDTAGDKVPRRSGRASSSTCPPSQVTAAEPAVQQGSKTKTTKATPKAVSMTQNANSTPAPSKKRKQAPGASSATAALYSAKTPSSSAKKLKSSMPVQLEIPNDDNVRAALIKGGYKLSTSATKKDGNLYCRPCGMEFKSVQELRSDLCAYGVSCKCGGITTDDVLVDIDDAPCKCWTSDDKWTIHLWVRYAVVLGSQRKGEVHEMGEHAAWGYLKRLGFKEMTKSGLEVYVFPEVKKPSNGTVNVNMFNTLRDMVEHLSRFGLPKNCKFAQLSNDERMELEYHISTSRFRVKTFALIPRESATVDEGSKTRTRPQRNSVAPTVCNDVTDETATVVSISSGSISAPASLAKNKAGRPKKQTKRPIEHQESSPPMESPSRTAQMSNTGSAQPVSPSSPFVAYEQEVPEYIGTDREKLQACLDVLNSPEFSSRPTIINDESSGFASKIRCVSEFLRLVVETKAKQGGPHGEGAALYVCGAPGLGKSSGVKWCCAAAVEEFQTRDNVKISICELNASSLTTASNPMQSILKEIGKCMHLKAASPTLEMVKRALASYLVVVVIDEIDALVSSNGLSTSKGRALATLLAWANEPNMQIAVIGISNCMNDENFQHVFGEGLFTNDVTFAAYSSHELKKILEGRVGTSVFASSTIDFIAKRVAANSGDARSALEMAARAVQFRLDQIKDDTSTTGPIVLIPHVTQSNKDETANIKDRIEGLPMAGKVVLCTLMAFAQDHHTECTIGELRDCVSDCLRQNGSEDDMLTMDDFLVLLETLVESGLILASSKGGSSGGEFRLSGRNVSDVNREKMCLGLQLEEVQKALDTTLTQSFYQNLRATAQQYRVTV